MVSMNLHSALKLGSSNWFHTCQLAQSRAVAPGLMRDLKLSYDMGASFQLLCWKLFWAGKTRIRTVNIGSERGRRPRIILYGVREFEISARGQMSPEQIISCSIALHVNVRVAWKLLDFLMQPRSSEKCEGITNHMLPSLLSSCDNK